MANYFDQFDPQKSSKQSGNYFDQFDSQKGAGQGEEITAGQLAGSALSSLGKGAADFVAGVGKFSQAPISTANAWWDGAALQAEKALNWASRGLIDVNPDLARQAQDSSAEAARAREANVDAEGGTWLNPLTAVARFGKGMEQGFGERSQDISVLRKDWSPAVEQSAGNISSAEGFLGTLKAIKDNPAGMVPTLFESLPAMAIGAIGSSGMARATLSRGAAEAELAAASAAKAGLSVAEQQAAASVVLEKAKQEAVRLASGAGVAAEAGTAAIQSQQQLAQQVMQTPIEMLQAESQRFRELSATMSPEAARERLANEIGDQAAGLVGIGTAAGSRITSKIFGGDETAKILAGVEKTSFRAAGKNAVQEGIEEVLQGIPEDLAQHGAMLEADPNHKLDLGKSAAQNFVAGAAMGGPASFGAAVRDNYQGAKDKAQELAGKLRGEPATADAPASPPPAATAPEAAPAATEAEKALYEPRALTSLDRVQEIDKERQALQARREELGGAEYGPAFDTERADVFAQITGLDQERAELTKGWPKMQAGAPATFTTEAGARVDAQYAIVDADELVTSHDTNLRPDPRFPADLQPRERDRAASEMQISGIVQKLDPARLGQSADAANGAPIVGADGLVESGNARTIALKRTYEANGLKADEYRAWLRQNATQFGLDPAAVDSVANPVLVRVRQTPVDRAEFARQANASTVAQMSPSEQARSDAKRIDTMEDLQPDDAGDFSGPASMPFIRRFMAKLPSTEQSGMIDASGKLSTTGYARIRNAVMAKAYGDSPVLQRMVESMDDNLRNISKALMVAAPRVAAMREAVGAGVRHQADITPDLMQSVEELSRLKDAGTSISDALAQTDLMGEKYSPETREILQFLGDNMRRPKRMADFIVAYMEALDAAGDPNQAGLFGDVEAPTKSALMGQARKALDGEPAAAAEGEANPGRGQPGEDAKADSAARGEPAPAPIGAGRDQGDGAAAAGQGEWVAFPPESGTLGIPRAEMPQVMGKDRGALLQFLGGRGITYEKGEAPAASLKPTQAEFSREKVDRFKAQGKQGDRSVLVSSDGHVLDGHHQWKAMAELGENIPEIRLSAPIRELLAAVEQFPSVKRSEGAADLSSLRAEAVTDFKDALADLADIVSKHTRASMLPENTPGLMPTLVKLFDAAIRIVGTDLKKATSLVQAELKKNKALAKVWNRIAPETYRKAALQALDAMQGQPKQASLFDSVEEASSALQGDLFASAPAPAPAPAPEAPKSDLILAKDAPSKSKPVVLVFGGSFNPIHEGHVAAVEAARQKLVDAGYKVDKTIVVPSPQHLLVRKSGASAQSLGHRTKMAKDSFARLADQGFVVEDAPSREADANEGIRKPKRYDTADWAQDLHPDATIINVTGQDQAHPEAPGFPSVYKVHSESGKSKDGYFFLALPRDESEDTGISSSKIRKKIANDEELPAEWANSAVVGYFRALVGKSNQLAIDGELFDLDAQDFGQPFPKTLPSDSPLLQETYDKARHDEIAASPVEYAGVTVPRSQMWAEIVDHFFAGKSPAPANRKPIAYVMGGGGASGKGTIKAKLMKQGLIDAAEAIDIDADAIKLSLPEYNAIAAAGDSRGAAVVHEESSMLSKVVRQRAFDGRYDVTLDVTLGNPKKDAEELQKLKDMGYEVRLFGVNIEPETAVKRAVSRGFETGRFVPIKMLLEAHAGFAKGWETYWKIADDARLYDTSDGVLTVAEKQGETLNVKHRKAYNRFAERSAINAESRTYREVGSYRNRAAGAGGQADAQPRGTDANPGPGDQGGNAQGGDQGSQGPRQDGGSSVPSQAGSDAADQAGRGLDAGRRTGVSDADRQPGEVRAEGQGAEAARQPAGDGQAQRVGEGSGRPDQLRSGQSDAAAADGTGLGQARPDGVRSSNEDGGEPESGKRARRAARVPGGRDLPAKSGLNYRFGQDDLTYEGSWFKKAEQNVEAVELLKKLQAEGRQATQAEQAVLAKFIGWGASELANTLFGKKLDKAAQQKAAYDKIIGKMDAKGRDYLSKGGRWRGDYADDGYYEALSLVKEARNDNSYGYYPDRITKEDLAVAKPDTSLLRYVELRDRLKAAMSKEEWAEAARSTQYAHYTSKSVVQSQWKAMQRMGFAGGTVLEPGAGIGVFPGLMPEGMAATSHYTGIEFDTMTGGILQQLFPDERILVESFVESKLPKDFFDVAIGNPPFSQTKILSDPEYAKKALSLHDYFFAKTIDRVKPGGLVAFVTSRYTMDKLDDKARAYLADKADLVGAIRLPQTAFKQNAGTEVVTDVIFLRKKVPGEKFEHAQPWMKTAEVKGKDGKTLMVKDKDGADRPALVNEYFAAHPEMVLGHHDNTGSMYSDKEYTVTPRAGSIEDYFAKAIENLPANIYQAERGSQAEAAKVREIDFNPKAKKEGNFYVTDAGVLMQREGGIGQRVELKSPAQVELVKDFVPLRDALKQAHYDQLNDGAWEQSLAELQKAYKTFTDKHGLVSQFREKTVNVTVVDEETGEKVKDEQTRRSYPILDALKDDPDWTLVAALEKVNDDTGAITPSEFLTTRVLGKPAAPEVASASDALLTVLNDIGHVDMAVVAARAGMSEAEAIESLGSSVYQDPSKGWVMADDYLSGNVKRKLQEARAAARTDRRYERNVAALEAVQPAPKAPAQINVAIGMNWMPGGVYSQFMQEITGLAPSIEWNNRTKQWALDWETPEAWAVENKGGARMGVYKSKAGAAAAAAKKDGATVRFVESAVNKSAMEEWGTDSVNAFEILEHALTGKQIRVEKTDPKTKSRSLDDAATEAANAKLQKLREAFESWIWKDQARTDMLVQQYNDRFNTTVPRTFNGNHLTLPGASKTFKIFDHVKRGAWRIIQKGNTYLAHAVGSGKTFQMVISAMEQKRLGLIKKPMIVVPNHMLQQFASEWQQLYPAARLMVADENNFHTDNRRRFVSRVALSDLDGVVITHSAFKLLDLDPEFKDKMIQEQLVFLEAALEEAGGKPGEKSRDPKVKQIQRQIENLEQKLGQRMSSAGKDANVRFDELGVDFLYVDEAHEFRKLDFATSRQVKGLSSQGSARAFDLFMKSRWLEEKHPGRSLVMASGTPVTNTMAEMYTVQKFMDPKALEERDIEDFDSWASMFGRESTQLEANAAGTYEPVTRFNKFVNVPELTQMFRDFADVLTSDHLAALLGDKRPKVEGGARKIIVTPKQRAYPAYQRQLEARVKASREWKPSKDEPNNPDPMIRIIGDGRLAAIDMRFVDPTAPSDPDSKLNRMIDDVIATYKATSDMEFTDKAGNVEPNKGASMMVFSDLGFGEGVAANRGFNARAWFEKRLKDAGIPASQIAFMSDHKKSTEKLKLYKDVNAGRIRIVVGSSKNMGTGVNAQQRLKALFHLDSPWYPADLEQREGRIVRQGNKNKKVGIYAYAAKGSYDQVMWQMLASKQQFIDLALSGDPNVRELEDLSSQSEYELAAAMTAEDPRVMQLAGMRADIAKMERLYQAHEESRIKARDRYRNAEDTIRFLQDRLPDAEAAAGKAQDLSGDNWSAKIGNKSVGERAVWADALDAIFSKLSGEQFIGTKPVGSVSGFDLVYSGGMAAGQYTARIDLMTPAGPQLIVAPGASVAGYAQRARNAVDAVRTEPDRMRERIRDQAAVRDSLTTKIDAPFPMADMLAEKIKEADDLANAIAADSKDKPFWVESKATGKGFEVQAPNAEIAIERARETNGGNADEWTARPAEAPAADTRASRATGQPLGVKASELDAMVAMVSKAMPGLPPVEVLASPSSLPADHSLRRSIEAMGAMGDAEGALHDGKVYLFADHLADMDRAEHVLLEHEAAHAGLRVILGDQLKTTMQAIYNSNGKVRRQADALRASNTGMSVAHAVEEAIVDIPTAELPKLAGWRKLVERVSKALDAAGFKRIAARLGRWLDGTLAEQQRADLFVANLVREARASLYRGPADVGATGTALSGKLSDDLAAQEKWLMTEARARGYKDIEDLLAKNYPLFEKLAAKWREKHPADALLSRAPAEKTAQQRADDIISTPVGRAAPLDRLAQTATRITGIEKGIGLAYDWMGRVLMAKTPEKIKAGIISDYGVPGAVIDQRAMLQGRQRVQLRKAGQLIDKLATLTREESRVAYAWMNEADPQEAARLMDELPAESVQVLGEVAAMIDKLSKEAMAMGQLSPEAYERNKFAYLRRSYMKHVIPQDEKGQKRRGRAIALLGEQYKGRGLTEAAPMRQIQNTAPEWWRRKVVDGKADTSLKGQKFIRLERHAPSGEGTGTLDGMSGRSRGKLLEVNFWPAGETMPAKYSDWDQAGTWEVRDVKGGDVVFWRDFTKAEREKMGEIDEARFAIAKTLHGMIHDVEVGRYLEWLSRTYALKPGVDAPGPVVDASERYRDTFAPGEWVQVPETKIPGTNVAKYGKLAGRYLPGPIWNDLRQTVSMQAGPLGETYQKILTAWKTAKTALSPAVHTNNIMSNFVMADWHDVGAKHIAKALRIILAAHKGDGKGLIGGAGNKLGALGIADREAAREVMNRYLDSGGDIGGWVTAEISKDQIEPLLQALQAESDQDNPSIAAQVGVMAALQHAVHARFPEAWESFKAAKSTGQVVQEGKSLIDLYQSEDDVFRLAAWLKAKEAGRTDIEAGKAARSSFLDYRVNAPWIQAMRQTAWPFVSFSYRAIPMLLETAGKRPHKLMKLMALAGALNALGVLLSGGDDDKERALLPEEKAGRIWGLVPKLIRMPWNDDHGSPVYLDIRRFIPVGDVVDTGAGHSAVPLVPALQPGGPMVTMAEIVLNKQGFSGKPITLETDTKGEQAGKLVDYLWKAYMPNLLGVPGTYATTGVGDAIKGRTDAFGREMSVAQAVASSMGVKLGSYPVDVMRKNLQAKAQAEMREIDANISQLKRQRQTNRIDAEEFQAEVQRQQEKKRQIMRKLAEKQAAHSVQD